MHVMSCTAGQERFSTITANYYRGAQGALLVYDIGLRDSFVHAKSWFERAKQLGGEDIEAVLVGNKNDLSDAERQVSCWVGGWVGTALTWLSDRSSITTAFLCVTNTRRLILKVSFTEGEALARELGIPFLETSALNGNNVEGAFVCMTSNIKKSVDRRGLTGVKSSNLQQAGGVQLASGEAKTSMMSRCCGR